jgi:hypothetical protein
MCCLNTPAFSTEKTRQTIEPSTIDYQYVHCPPECTNSHIQGASFCATVCSTPYNITASTMAISRLDRLGFSYVDDRVQCRTQWTADRITSYGQLVNQTLCDNCETRRRSWKPQVCLTQILPRCFVRSYTVGGCGCDHGMVTLEWNLAARWTTRMIAFLQYWSGFGSLHMQGNILYT